MSVFGVEGEASSDDTTMNAIKKQKKLRATAMASITSRYNELKQLMKNPWTVDVNRVNDKRSGLEIALKEFFTKNMFVCCKK